MLPVQHRRVRDNVCNLLLKAVEHSATRAKYFPQESMKAKHLRAGIVCKRMSGLVLGFLPLCHVFQFVKTKLNSGSEFLSTLLVFNPNNQTSPRLPTADCITPLLPSLPCPAIPELLRLLKMRAKMTSFWSPAGVKLGSAGPAGRFYLHVFRLRFINDLWMLTSVSCWSLFALFCSPALRGEKQPQAPSNAQILGQHQLRYRIPLQLKGRLG